MPPKKLQSVPAGDGWKHPNGGSPAATWRVPTLTSNGSEFGAWGGGWWWFGTPRSPMGPMGRSEDRWTTKRHRHCGNFNGEHDPLTSGFSRYPGTLFWEFQTHPLIRGYPGILQPLTPPVCHWLTYGWILCVCYRWNAATAPQPWLTSDSTSGLPVAFRSLAQPGSAGPCCGMPLPNRVGANYEEEEDLLRGRWRRVGKPLPKMFPHSHGHGVAILIVAVASRGATA